MFSIFVAIEFFGKTADVRVVWTTLSFLSESVGFCRRRFVAILPLDRGDVVHERPLSCVQAKPITTMYCSKFGFRSFHIGFI